MIAGRLGSPQWPFAATSPPTIRITRMRINHAGLNAFSRLLAVLTFASALPVAGAADVQPGPMTRPAVRRPHLPVGVKLIADLHYGDAPGEGNLLDVYTPESASGPLPLIVWIHGGGWSAGDKSGCPAVLMVPRGYVVASLNYRLSQAAKFPAQINDCKGAIRWLRPRRRLPHRSRPRGLVGRVGGRSPGRAAGHVGRREGAGRGRRRQPRPVQQGAGGLRLVRPYRLPPDVTPSRGSPHQPPLRSPFEH